MKNRYLFAEFATLFREGLKPLKRDHEEFHIYNRKHESISEKEALRNIYQGQTVFLKVGYAEQELRFN